MQISIISSKKAILICKLFCFAIVVATVVWWANSFFRETEDTYIRTEGLADIRITSTEYQYFSYLIANPYTVIHSKKPLFYKTVSPSAEMPPDHYSFTFLFEDNQQILLHYSPTSNVVYNQDYGPVEVSTDVKELLLDLAAIYRQEVFKTYGELTVWEDADKAFPMFATAKITDIYTGASFNVQRREGSSHVDAQPLTAEDTAVMKKIYGGQWSWDRKGIIVEVQGQRIAASMHGMPHGSGKIDDNNFPGHFCIHFLGSIIHGGGMDIRHHREILKAAGKLPIGDF